MSHELSLKKLASTEANDAISSISAIAYGFMGSQALFAALELGLFTTLYADRRGPHNAALFLFGQLSASAQTQAYTIDELGAAVQEAGYVDVAMQPFLPDLTFLVSGRKP